jgi:hypothetical protein
MIDLFHSHWMEVLKFPKKTVLICGNCGVTWPCLEAQLNAIEKGKKQKSNQSKHPNRNASG